MENGNSESLSAQKQAPGTEVRPNSKPWALRILDTFLQNEPSLKYFISRFLVSPHDIEDISQETFLRAYEAEKKKHIDEPKAFLFRIAQNLVLSNIKKKSVKITDYIEDTGSIEDLVGADCLESNLIAQQKLGIFCEAVATLSPQCRRAFLLRKVYGMSIKSIAEHMDISVSTVEKHLGKGIRDCRRIVDERYSEVGRAPQRVGLSKTPGGRV